MPSSHAVPFLLRLLLAMLLAVNGIAPALGAGAMEHAAPVATQALSEQHPDQHAELGADPHAAVATAGEQADCHDSGAAQDAAMAEAPAACCDDGQCLAGCECACMALAAALPMSLAPAWIVSLRAAPAHALAHAHAPPPPTGVTRPPIA